MAGAPVARTRQPHVVLVAYVVDLTCIKGCFHRAARLVGVRAVRELTCPRQPGYLGEQLVQPTLFRWLPDLLFDASEAETYT
jgi:hypothetical protein